MRLKLSPNAWRTVKPNSLLDKVENGRLKVQQGIIAGCSGGNYENVIAAANALRGQSCGNDTFSLAVYPSSQPVFMDLAKKVWSQI